MSKKIINSQPILDNLFNSRVRVKVLKYLFRNYPGNFGIHQLADRVQESEDIVRKEMAQLEVMGLIRKN